MYLGIDGGRTQLLCNPHGSHLSSSPSRALGRPQSVLQPPSEFSLHCCSCSRTSLGGALRNAALSTHSSPQAKGVKDHGVAPPPCAQPRPCPARLGSPGPWRAVTRVVLEARADQEPESLNIFHFLPERQPRRGQGLADNATMRRELCYLSRDSGGRVRG